MSFLSIHVVDPYSSIDSDTAWKNFVLFFSEISDLKMTDIDVDITFCWWDTAADVCKLD